MKVTMERSGDLNLIALGAAIRSFFPDLTNHQIEVIRTIYQTLVLVPQLDQAALKDLQNVVQGKEPAI